MQIARVTTSSEHEQEQSNPAEGTECHNPTQLELEENTMAHNINDTHVCACGRFGALNILLRYKKSGIHVIEQKEKLL